MGALYKFEIDKIREKFNLTTLVETGTFKGTGVQFALDKGFKKVISIEIDEELSKAAQEKFKDYDVKIITGDSSEVMQTLTIKGNALFWLDAHFPGADAGKARYDAVEEYNTRLPLEKEINFIKSRVGKYADVIICDDLCIYEDNKELDFNFDKHCNDHGFGVTRKSVGGKGIDFIHNAFDKTHTIKKIYKDQGYIAILPNEI